MGFPAKRLSPGEQVAVDVRPHWKCLSRPVLLVVLVVAGSAAALVERVPRWSDLALGGALVLCLAWLATRYLRWATTSFVVTNERLVLRKGVLMRSGREILLDRLTDISYRQTLLDRLVRCGDVLLESPGRDSAEVFEDLPRPVRIQAEIYRMLRERRSGSGGDGSGGDNERRGAGEGPTGATGETSTADQLSQLDDLRRRGIITKREFAAKKAELLSRM